MPIITVIVPVYNVQSYVRECIDSIVNQSLKNIEIICIDDGSTDDSGAILDEYAQKDFRIKVIHKPNSGYGSTMNLGLQSASGEYIAVVESDDFAESKMLESLYFMAVENRADIVKGDFFRHRSGTDMFANRLKDFPKNEVLSLENCPSLVRLADTIWTCLYRRQFLLDNNICFHETPGASFQDISFALLGWLYAKRVYLTDMPVIHYRNDNPGQSMKAPGKVFCVFDEYKWVESKFSSITFKNPLIKKYFIAAKYIDYLNHYRRVDSVYQYALLVRLEEEALWDKEAGNFHRECFTPSAWDEISKICEDKNAFFLKTVKDMKDMRLDYCKFINNDIYYKGFISQLKNFPEIIIYGAGFVGQRLAAQFKREGVFVSCFVVTDSENAPSECMGIPVKSIRQTLSKASDCVIIVAVAKGNQYELYDMAQRLGFKNIFHVDDIVRKRIDASLN